MKRILILFSCVPQVSPLWPNLYLNPQFASVFVLLCRPACCVPCVSCITVAAYSLLVTQSVPGFCLVRVKLSSWESCIGFHLLPATQCHVTVGASWYWPCFTQFRCWTSPCFLFGAFWMIFRELYHFIFTIGTFNCFFKRSSQWMYPQLWVGADSRPDALPDANLETLASLDPMTLGSSPYLGSSMYKVDVLTT